MVYQDSSFNMYKNKVRRTKVQPLSSGGMAKPSSSRMSADMSMISNPAIEVKILRLPATDKVSFGNDRIVRRWL